MALFTALRHDLETYLAEPQIKTIYSAYLLAAKAHTGQTRMTGEPYITHPVAVARILACMHLDPQSIMAALMHDVIEDTGVDKATLSAKFGSQVAELVDGVSKLTQIEFETKAEAQAENFRKMVLAMVRDIRVILVKLADRLHNMRTIDSLPPAKRRRIAQETLEIYAPIANRLGMHNFRIEFEDLGFAALHPLRYRILQSAVNKARGNRQEILAVIENALRKGLETFHIAEDAVWGRGKHLYSIYHKMRYKRLSLAEIMDVYGFRIVVDSVDMCYRVLGVVHSLYKPLPERFKDYIAIPKANGYQSLHTTLFGPYGVPIEIQIRTEAMHRMAENGIAAHWLYKSTESIVNDAQIRAREWLKGLMEMQKTAVNSLDFIENVKIDLFPDEVYVFTPRGVIMELPSGASAVDFAYAVHSDIGDTCVAAKIDKRPAPLSTTLSSGQTVEIITSSDACPNAAWLNFVVTGKARSKIRHFLKTQRRTEALALGRRLLNKHLLALGANWEEVSLQIIKQLLQELAYPTSEDLFEAIGLGNEMPLVIAHRLTGTLPRKDFADQQSANKVGQPLLIKGSKGYLVSFAECCRPIPGDPIVGFLDAGNGLVIHLDDCSYANMPRHSAQREEVSWAGDVEGEFKASLCVEVVNQPGVLAKLAGAIAAAESNIDSININEQEGHCTIIRVLLSVKDRTHLAEVIRRIRAVRVVAKISRDKG